MSPYPIITEHEQTFYPIDTFTACGHRIVHRKWKETKLQPGTAGPGNRLGCSLVSFHFLWAILCPQAVQSNFLRIHAKWNDFSRVSSCNISPLRAATSFALADDDDLEWSLTAHWLERHSSSSSWVAIQKKTIWLEFWLWFCDKSELPILNFLLVYSARAQDGPQDMERKLGQETCLAVA